MDKVQQENNTFFTETMFTPYNLLQECSVKLFNTDYVDHVFTLPNWLSSIQYLSHPLTTPQFCVSTAELPFSG